jgi:outer membrane protein OmpA-like peptidoglycan-associated protein
MRETTGLKLRATAGALLLAAGVAIGFAGCAGANQGAMRCPYAGWSGSCTLKALNKTREVEFPQPHSVFEAIYTPVQDPNGGGNAPPDVREDFKVLARNEIEFRDFMLKNGTVPCAVQQTGDATCNDVKVAVNVPPFVPTGAGDGTQVAQKTGCAKLESNSSDPPPASSAQPAQLQPNEFFFEQNLSDVNQQLIEQVNTAAAVLKQNPGIECIGVVGQVTSGESPSLAGQRAVTIKTLLVGAGVEEARLTTFTATVRLYGTGVGLAEPDPKERKVALRAMLMKTP